jgi:hypothetical protein
MHSGVFKKTSGAMFVVAALAASPASALGFVDYDSKNFGNELITTIPADQSHQVLYSIDVDSLNANDVLLVMSEFEATNDTTATQRLSSQIILTNSATSTTGTGLDYQNSRNVTKNGGMHHIVRVKGGIRKFTGAQGENHFVNLIVWATGNLSVPASSGRLQALKISP